MNGYPKGFLISLIAVFSLLWLSGLLLTPSVAMFKLQWEEDWLMESALASGSLRQAITALHAIFGWLMLWFIGALFTIHMRNHWRRKENKTSGSCFSIAWLILIATALGIYYFGNETLSLYSTYIHLGLGVVMPLLLWLHRRKGKQAVAR